MIEIDTDVDEPLPEEQVKSMSLIEVVRYREIAQRDACIRMAAQASREIVRRDHTTRLMEHDVELEEYICPVCGHDNAGSGWASDFGDIYHNTGARWGYRWFACCECDTAVYYVPYEIERLIRWQPR